MEYIYLTNHEYYNDFEKAMKKSELYHPKSYNSNIAIFEKKDGYYVCNTDELNVFGANRPAHIVVDDDAPQIVASIAFAKGYCEMYGKAKKMWEIMIEKGFIDNNKRI